MVWITPGVAEADPSPVADANGPYAVSEGAGVTLNGTGSTASASATFAWDVDNDGQFDDATGVNPTLTAGQLAALGLGDGPAGPTPVSLRITDGADTSVDATTLTVNNAAPVASVAGPVGAVAGLPATATFGASDPSSADAAAGFTYAIDWGDGTPVQSVTGGAAGTVVPHLGRRRNLHDRGHRHRQGRRNLSAGHCARHRRRRADRRRRRPVHGG